MSDDLTKKAAQAGIDSFMRSFGRLPDQFALLNQYAPSAFAGYGLIRSGLMRGPESGGHLDIRTKELIFTVLDTLHGDLKGARNHATVAMQHGLTLEQLAEGLVQVLVVGGITTWNNVGVEVMRHCIALSQPPVRDEQPQGQGD